MCGIRGLRQAGPGAGVNHTGEPPLVGNLMPVAAGRAEVLDGLRRLLESLGSPAAPTPRRLGARAPGGAAGGAAT
ncbi:hypothetical protein CHLRE_02g144606v5 [Chlamydomonas reinhardtii]|uniref:Uncharacterized protein n=1 Tax=Chlamydomonas reinhardtii TaxID=3055 RepID=A0A2K3E3T8_CHLRE|nr:uncharacterized protein CHLRE_02g144606v5 [Chlamydomonas reinhardtii]XP_042927748.1 uncharacterized protein CHLRE_02g144606v5 [Chlamydomonas reinhardtii]PNW87465.1 hypothetical protein CHLRE_02g144606v5 [Chlamydomonas reinhardtii]PNW87466.1 hypothetical protein CHLRE_02g144606v5 [Chlamydomonas reinhardtii]